MKISGIKHFKPHRRECEGNDGENFESFRKLKENI